MSYPAVTGAAEDRMNPIGLLSTNGSPPRRSAAHGKVKDFTAEAGKAVDLGDLVIKDPERTKNLPDVPAPKKK